MKSFNINNYVKVRLTDKGRDIYYHQYDNLNKGACKMLIKPEYPKEDEHGYYKDQLWHLISIFGEFMGMGRDNPFHTEILFYDKDLESKSVED